MLFHSKIQFIYTIILTICGHYTFLYLGSMCNHCSITGPPELETVMRSDRRNLYIKRKGFWKSRRGKVMNKKDKEKSQVNHAKEKCMNIKI